MNKSLKPKIYYYITSDNSIEVTSGFSLEEAKSKFPDDEFFLDMSPERIKEIMDAVERDFNLREGSIDANFHKGGSLFEAMFC